MKKSIEGPRNSPLRKNYGPINRFAKKFTERFPDLTADKISQLGLLTVGFGSVLKVISEQFSFAKDIASLSTLILLTLGKGTDVLDGSVARLTKKPDSVDIDGALKDVKSDRQQELLMNLSRMATASMRKDPLGVAAAFLSGITGPLPSLLRAKVEALGTDVPESGKNPLSILGMSLPRSIFSVIATSYPEKPFLGYPIQRELDSLLFIGNSFAILERRAILKKAKKGELPKSLRPEEIELGKQKTETLSKFNKLNIATMIAAGAIALINALQ